MIKVKKMEDRKTPMSFTITFKHMKKMEEACAILGITNYSKYIRMLIDDDVVQSIRRKVKIDYYMGGGK